MTPGWSLRVRGAPLLVDAPRLSPFASALGAIVLVAVSCSRPREPAPPANLTAAEKAAIVGEIEKDRAETETWLKTSPTSYLATILRRDFGDRSSLTVGRAEDNDVRLDDPAILPHHLRVTGVGDSFRVEGVDSPARFRTREPAESGKKDEMKEIERREARLGPTSILAGRYTLRLSHQRYPAIIVSDSKAPRFAEYKGLRYFPVDLAYRYEIALTPNPAPDTLVIMSTRGNPRRAVRAGWFEFAVGGTPCRLGAVRLLEPGVGEDDLSVFFRDATTGKESYAVGRYVDVKKTAGGRYILDFNLAYNPACALSDHYNCPIPPAENNLPVAIRAGEMDAHYH